MGEIRKAINGHRWGRYMVMEMGSCRCMDDGVITGHRSGISRESTNIWVKVTTHMVDMAVAWVLIKGFQ